MLLCFEGKAVHSSLHLVRSALVGAVSLIRRQQRSASFLFFVQIIVQADERNIDSQIREIAFWDCSFLAPVVLGKYRWPSPHAWQIVRLLRVEYVSLSEITSCRDVTKWSAIAVCCPTLWYDVILWLWEAQKCSCGPLRGWLRKGCAYLILYPYFFTYLKPFLFWNNRRMISF